MQIYCYLYFTSLVFFEKHSNYFGKQKDLKRGKNCVYRKLSITSPLKWWKAFWDCWVSVHRKWPTWERSFWLLADIYWLLNWEIVCSRFIRSPSVNFICPKESIAFICYFFCYNSILWFWQIIMHSCSKNLTLLKSFMCYKTYINTKVVIFWCFESKHLYALERWLNRIPKDVFRASESIYTIFFIVNDVHVYNFVGCDIIMFMYIFRICAFYWQAVWWKCTGGNWLDYPWITQVYLFPQPTFRPLTPPDKLWWDTL